MGTYIGELKQIIDLKEEIESLQKKVESLREQLSIERKHNDIIVQQRDDAVGDLSQAKEDIESLRKQRNMLINFLKNEDCLFRGWISVWRCFIDENPEAKNWLRRSDGNLL